MGWDLVPSTDLYSISLLRTDTSAPTPTIFFVQTAAAPPLRVDDLRPDTTYHFVLRSHPSSAPSMVWGWRNGTADIFATTCTTAAASNVPVPRRAGALASTSITLSEGTVTRSNGVMVARLGDAAVNVAQALAMMALRPDLGGYNRVLLGDSSSIEGLEPSSTYAGKWARSTEHARTQYTHNTHTYTHIHTAFLELVPWQIFCRLLYPMSRCGKRLSKSHLPHGYTTV